jgi:tRNA(fMet)-specific endonuclease VapC
VERLASYRREDVALCVITVAELLFGAHLSRQPIQNVALCQKFCASFRVFPLTGASAELSTDWAYDVLIAGIALAEDRVLVTHNTREFGRVPRLEIEDWVAL